MDMMVLKLLLVLATSFIVTFLTAPPFMEKLREKGYLVKDYYKKDHRLVPTLGGLVILGGVLGSLIVAQIIFPSQAEKLLIFYFIVISYGIFGLLDDLINIGRKSKIILPFFLALPIALLNMDTSLWLVFTQIEMGIFYTFLIAPVYVMVVSNLVNMHSGYNGLSSGLTTILFIFVGIASTLQNGIGSLLFLAPILGATLAFYHYNKHPSRLFDGNIGSLMLGSALGGLIILNNLEVFGVIILTPHIINFLMYVVWKIKKVGEIKFGELRSDGTLEVPNPLTMKWILPYFMRLTEYQATYILYGVTTLFGVIGLLLNR